MPCVGFILRPQKRPRVLTAALSAAAAARGLSLVALDPGSTPEQWMEAGVNVLVHKVPDEPGLDGRLESWAAAAAAAEGGAGGGGGRLCLSNAPAVLLDPPLAVRRLQDREAMLAPLAGQQLMFTQQDSATQHNTVEKFRTVAVTVPKQTVLQPGCSTDSVLLQLATAGLQFPLLVKPLVSAATDSVRPTGEAAAAAAAAPGNSSAALPAAAAIDGHTIGVIFTNEALRTLVEQQQQPQQIPIALPAVLQQYVPHEALYKLYVIGPSCILTRRNTITPDILESAATAAGKQGVVILPRLSADKLAAVAAAKQQQQQQQEQGPAFSVAPRGQPGATISQATTTTTSSSSSSTVGAALADASVFADASVLGDAVAPPLWALQQLAAHMRKVLGMSLFNLDIIVPDCGSSCVADHDVGVQGGQQQLQSSVQQLLVVDINYFPGYDKIPGAEELFADFLAQCAGCHSKLVR